MRNNLLLGWLVGTLLIVSGRPLAEAAKDQYHRDVTVDRMLREAYVVAPPTRGGVRTFTGPTTETGAAEQRVFTLEPTDTAALTPDLVTSPVTTATESGGIDPELLKQLLEPGESCFPIVPCPPGGEQPGGEGEGGGGGGEPPPPPDIPGGPGPGFSPPAPDPRSDPTPGPPVPDPETPGQDQITPPEGSPGGPCRRPASSC